jgi:protein-tyrosine kinase
MDRNRFPAEKAERAKLMSRNFDMLNEAAPQIGAATAVKAKAAAVELPAVDSKGGAANEEIVRLVQGIFLSAPVNDKCKAVAFCGIDRRAGCSWICAQASEFLASQTSGRVCVIDANLRSPSLHRHFRTKLDPGLAQAMRESAPIEHFVRSTWTDHLWLLTAGEVGAEPSAALSLVRLQARIAEMRDEFDFLLIDAPAVSASRDAMLIGRLTDGIVLVVASNSTRREPARVAKESFDEAKVPILGAVLNKRTYPIPEAVYRRL